MTRSQSDRQFPITKYWLGKDKQRVSSLRPSFISFISFTKHRECSSILSGSIGSRWLPETTGMDTSSAPMMYGCITYVCSFSRPTLSSTFPWPFFRLHTLSHHPSLYIKHIPQKTTGETNVAYIHGLCPPKIHSSQIMKLARNIWTYIFYRIWLPWSALIERGRFQKIKYYTMYTVRHNEATWIKVSITYWRLSHQFNICKIKYSFVIALVWPL